MIVRVDPATASVAVLSIPRDLWVPIHGTGGGAKINSAFAAGPQVLIDTIQDELHIPINHYIEVDCAGFQNIIDAMDGIPIYFDTAMRDTNSGLNVNQSGCINLDASAALAFARSRHLEYNDAGHWTPDNGNDFGRMQRQQFLLQRTATALKAHGVLTNPIELNNLASTAADNLGIDPGLTLGDLMGLADLLKNSDPQTLTRVVLAATRYYPAPDGSDALRLDPSAATALTQFGGPAPTSTPPARPNRPSPTTAPVPTAVPPSNAHRPPTRSNLTRRRQLQLTSPHGESLLPHLACGGSVRVLV